MNQMSCEQSLVHDDDCMEDSQQACAKLDSASSSASFACYVDCLVPTSWLIVLAEIEHPDLDLLLARD